MTAQEGQRARVLALPFNEPLQLLQTKPFDYNLLSKQLEKWAPRCGSVPPRPQRMLRLDNLPQELAMVYTTYAAALRHTAHQLVQEAGATVGSGGSGGQGTEPADGGAVAATRDDAACNGSSGGGGSSGDCGSGATGLQAALTVAVATLRRAAGVFGFLAEEVLPGLAGGGGGGAAVVPGDRPLELLVPAARCMQQLCLAEAQALVAATAAVKGMSPGTQRALHAGEMRPQAWWCSALFRQAQVSARELAAAAPPGLPPSDLLDKLLAVATALHEARAHHCLALEGQRDMELGTAEASCEECQRLLEAALRCLARSDPYDWAGCIKARKRRREQLASIHQATGAQLLAAVHKDRMSVTYQALPKQPPDATANAAIRVAVDVFQPLPVLPPVPVTTESGKGGCGIM
uniref:BRO1 domain-containing protein n=1 Tax=Yamagishiella unicocca TaxID=51707 RepID=A0A1W6R6K6_9CHLO|nr:hypothetical protein [Yamagishiella unicocca]